MENKVIYQIVRAIVAAVVVVALSFVGCTIHIDYQIGTAIKAGVDPIEARMALESDGYSEARFWVSILKNVKIEPQKKICLGKKND